MCFGNFKSENTLTELQPKQVRNFLKYQLAGSFLAILWMLEDYLFVERRALEPGPIISGTQKVNAVKFEYFNLAAIHLYVKTYIFKITIL